MAARDIHYRYGGKRGVKRVLVEDEGLLVVRTRSRRPLGRSALDPSALGLLESFDSVVRYEDAGVEVLRARVARGRKALRDRARRVLADSSDVQFAGRVLTDRSSDIPVLYTENLFVKFEDDVSSRKARKTLKDAGLTIKRELEYARGAWFVGAEEGSGRKVFTIASKLLADGQVQF